MANTVLKTDIVAQEALMLLDNHSVMANLVYRGYEKEYDKSVNGYTVGSTIRIRKPMKAVPRIGATAAITDVIEGYTNVIVNTQIGYDFQFTSQELTLDIRDLSERVIKPVMIPLANKIDQDLMALYKNAWNYVGTPGTQVSGFASFGRAPQRLTESAVPIGMNRKAVMTPNDNWGLLANTTGLFVDANNPAFKEAKLGRLGGVELYETANVATHTVGTKAGTPLIAGAAQNVTITTVISSGSVQGVVKDINAQNLLTDGWTVSSAILKQGDVFTLAGVFAINPITKASYTYLQQFVVNADVSSDGAGLATLSISPAIITSGAFQTVSAVPADNAAITVLGTASTGYFQNMAFDERAFTLVAVPMNMPQGVTDATQKSYKGLSCRIIPYYTGSSDVSSWRLDILYGVKAIFPDLAVRFGG